MELLWKMKLMELTTRDHPRPRHKFPTLSLRLNQGHCTLDISLGYCGSWRGDQPLYSCVAVHIRSLISWQSQTQGETMPNPNLISPSLRDACADPDTLFVIPQDDLVRLVYKEFSVEIDRLIRAYSIRDGWCPPASPSPSHILYQEDYDEVNRTLVGVLSLRWIHLGQYETFVASQPPSLRLTRESFDWIRDYYMQTVVDSNTLYVLIMSIVINDLGKDPQLALDYQELTGEDISQINHDAVLLKACTVGLIQSLQRLSLLDREDFMSAIELGATFNFGQLAQAESAPVCLTGLLKMKDNPRSFRIRFMEQLLDIAGAAGHMDWTCAKKLIQPIFESYRNVYEACQGVLSGNLDICGGYDLVLIRRAQFLHDRGFRLPSVQESLNDRALMRILCMGNVTTLETACLFEDTWNCLDDATRQALVRALNIDGHSGEPAVQPTYMPAFLTRIKDDSALTCALRYLRRIMSAVDLQDPSVVVIERSVLGVMKQFVETGIFDRDPTILEKIDVPEGVVAQIVSN